MNRSVIIGALVVLLGAGGYYQFSYKPAQEAAAKLEAEAAAAATAAADAAKKAEEEVAKAAEAAAAATTEAAAATTEAATDATAAATDAAAALDPANFNADSIMALIDGSALDDTMKGTLKTAVEAAKTNPALVADTIAQVKAALGM